MKKALFSTGILLAAASAFAQQLPSAEVKTQPLGDASNAAASDAFVAAALSNLQSTNPQNWLSASGALVAGNCLVVVSATKVSSQPCSTGSSGTTTYELDFSQAANSGFEGALR